MESLGSIGRGALAALTVGALALGTTQAFAAPGASSMRNWYCEVGCDQDCRFLGYQWGACDSEERCRCGFYGR
jgi:hypothetical protein